MLCQQRYALMVLSARATLGRTVLVCSHVRFHARYTVQGSTHFWLLEDQIRDWAIVLRPFHELPLVGPPAHVHGYTIGLAFYWILWGIPVTVGPWFAHADPTRFDYAQNAPVRRSGGRVATYP